jgi:Zn-finger protein
VKEEILKYFLTQLDFANRHFGFRDCTYYHCHKFPEGQEWLNCVFCYCPFYPCNGKLGPGKWIIGGRGKKVFDCSDCNFIHRDEIVREIFRLLYEGKSFKQISKMLKKEFKRER